MVGRTITIQGESGVLASEVLHGEPNTRTDRHLGTDDTVSTEETLAEHVHGTSLAEGDTLSSPKELAYDGLDRGTTHKREAVAAVGSDNLVVGGDSMFNTGSNGLLPRRKMAETTDLLFFVELVGGHLHSSVEAFC